MSFSGAIVVIFAPFWLFLPCLDKIYPCIDNFSPCPQALCKLPAMPLLWKLLYQNQETAVLPCWCWGFLGFTAVTLYQFFVISPSCLFSPCPVSVSSCSPTLPYNLYLTAPLPWCFPTSSKGFLAINLMAANILTAWLLPAFQSLGIIARWVGAFVVSSHASLVLQA